MKTMNHTLALVMLAIATINTQLSIARAQGTAFTYQGLLNSGANPANGNYDITFTLFNTNVTGVAIAGPVTNTAVGVTNGLFTTTVNFGNVFTGGNNWLQIAVSTNGANSFITLLPRQQLTPVPYAVYAANVSGISIQQNSDNDPNVILGSSENSVSNGVEGGAIGGGIDNTVGANSATVAGGGGNTASSYSATVAGGVQNMANGVGATVSGGSYNTASSGGATVAGGGSNLASGFDAIVAGGLFNMATGNRSFAAGTQAQALNDGAFVWADSTEAYFSSTNNDSFNVRAAGGARFVTSGAGMSVDGSLTIAGVSQYNSGLKLTGSSTSGTGMAIENTASGGHKYDLISGGASSGEGAGAFELYDEIVFNGFRLTITTNGNVGIGTIAPTTALQVNGVVTANSFSGSAGGLTGLSATALTGTVADANLSANVALLNRSTQNFTGSVNTFSGNVGIGTTTPNSALSVYGNIFMGKQRNNTTFNQVGDTIYLGAEQKYLGNTLGTPVNGSTDWINLMANSLSAGIIFGLSTSTANPHSNNIPLMVIQSNGNVGIGTTTPAAGLDVETAPAGVNHGNWGYLQQPGYTAGPLNGSPNLDIYTSGSIGASTYYAFSDERIKNIIGVSSSAKDLNTLMAIHVTDYTYKDTVTHGNGPVKKVIAQQVESVYPQAVSKTTGVIPDIYKQAAVKDGWVQLATSLKVGEKVKLIGESGQGIYQVLEVRLGEFRTDFKTDTDQVFVFGRQVDDFRNVDYEALSTLNISATQELTKKLEAESSEVSVLKQELYEMKTLVAQLARDNQDAKLADQTTSQTRASTSLRKPLITASLEN